MASAADRRRHSGSVSASRGDTAPRSLASALGVVNRALALLDAGNWQLANSVTDAPLCTSVPAGGSVRSAMPVSTSGTVSSRTDRSTLPGVARADLSRRVGKVVGYPPLSEMGERERPEFHEVLLEADTFEELRGKWQAAILKAEQNRPRLRIVGGD